MEENKKSKKTISILNESIWKLATYFILYSFIGYIIETIFGIVTKGVWECRQSFLYGPFLGIYGVGAIAIILFSKFFNKNNFTLFLGGYIIGSVTEYMISFFTEIFVHTQWWDYSNYILNLNRQSLFTVFNFLGNINSIFDKKNKSENKSNNGKNKRKNSNKYIKNNYYIINTIFDNRLYINLFCTRCFYC